MEQRDSLKLLIVNLGGGESDIYYISFIMALGIHIFTSVDDLKSQNSFMLTGDLWKPSGPAPCAKLGQGILMSSSNNCTCIETRLWSFWSKKITISSLFFILFLPSLEKSEFSFTSDRKEDRERKYLKHGHLAMKSLLLLFCSSKDRLFKPCVGQRALGNTSPFEMRHVCATCLYHSLMHILQSSSFSVTL